MYVSCFFDRPLAFVDENQPDSSIGRKNGIDMKRDYVFFIALILLGSFCFGQKDMAHDEDVLLEEGKQALIQQDFSLAIKKLTLAEEVAQKNHDDQALWRIKNFLGQSYSHLGMKGKSLSELSAALEILSNDLNSEKFQPIILNNLASLFIESQDYKESLFYIEKGLDIIQKYPEEQDLIPIKYYLVINKAYLYNEKGKYEEALEALEEINNSLLNTYPLIKQAWSLTRIQSFLLSGQIEEAKSNILKILRASDREDPYYDQILELAAKVFFQEKKYHKAIEYLNQSLFHTKDWLEKLNRYTLMANFYKETGNLQKQIIYKDSIIISKDSLANINNKELLQTTKIQLDIQKYKNELAINQQKQESQKQLFWIVIIGLVLLAATTFLWQKNRIIKQKREKVIIKNKEQLARLSLEEEKQNSLLAQNRLQTQIEISKRKQEELKNKIAFKNRKLATKALFLTERNQLIKDVLENINHIKEISEDKRIQNFIQSFKDELKVKEEWEDYVQSFEEINPNFFKELKRTHPALSNSDIRFLSYLYMNLTLQEIANVMVITIEACRKRKQRIAQKMNIQTHEVLDYLIQIESDNV